MINVDFALFVQFIFETYLFSGFGGFNQGFGGYGGYPGGFGNYGYGGYGGGKEKNSIFMHI